MTGVRVTFLGTGDAFGSGGRLQTAALVQTADTAILVDCGPSTLAALRARGFDPGAIDAILLTHLHGDHFGGVPFLVMDARYASGRTRALTVAGPPGLEDRTRQLHDLLFPGNGHLRLPFPLGFIEIEPGDSTRIGAVVVTPFPAVHPSGAPSYALRIEMGGRVLAFSGDTEWTDSLIDASRQADLFVCECFGYQSAPRHHLDYRTLQARRPSLTCRRLLLTHMGDDMLAHRALLAFPTTHDGLVIEL